MMYIMRWILWLAVGVLCWPSSILAETLIITGKQVNVRAGPGRTHDVIMVVAEHEKFEVLRQQDDWYQISVEGTVGWVSGKGITLTGEEDIHALLQQADIYFKRLQFTTPPEANAFDLYQQVLRRDPENAHALQKIQQMGQRYKLWAEQAAKEGDAETARTYYQRYLYIMPDDPDIQERLKAPLPPGPDAQAPLRIRRLRSEPQVLSAQAITDMIIAQGFNHPADWSKFDLAPSISGHIRHDYVVKSSQGAAVVIDYATNLMWPQYAADQPVSWKAAYDVIGAFNSRAYAGFTNWRLPTIEELTSLLEAEKQEQNLYLAPVFAPSIFWCWSADTAPSGQAAWYISFSSGGIQQQDVQNSAFVLAVRSME